MGASVAGLAYKMSGQNYTITFALATIPATLALLLTISVSASCRHSLLSARTQQMTVVLKSEQAEKVTCEVSCRHSGTLPRRLAPPTRQPKVCPVPAHLSLENILIPESHS